MPSKSLHSPPKPGTLETFLALNFRPSDSHCVHIDASASDETRDAMEGILRCYRERYPEANIFSIRFPIKVFWGSVSILEVTIVGFSDTTQSASAPKMRDCMG